MNPIQKDGGAGPTFGLAVLAGGEGRRLGGVSKADLRLRGERILDRILDDAWALDPGPAGTVVVGPESLDVSSECLRTSEQPPLGGPAAGVAAAVEVALQQEWPWLAVVPCDAPRVARCLPALLDAARTLLAPSDGVLAVAEGRDQNAVFLAPVEALAVACTAGVRDLSLRVFVSRLKLARVDVDPTWVADIDTPEDLRREL